MRQSGDGRAWRWAEVGPSCAEMGLRFPKLGIKVQLRARPPAPQAGHRNGGTPTRLMPTLICLLAVPRRMPNRGRPAPCLRACLRPRRTRRRDPLRLRRQSHNVEAMRGMIPESAATFCSKVNEEYVLSLAVPILRRSSSRAQGQSRIPDGRISDASRRRAPLPASSLAIRYGFLPCTLRLGPAWIIGRDAESAMETSVREAAARTR